MNGIDKWKVGAELEKNKRKQKLKINSEKPDSLSVQDKQFQQYYLKK